MAQYNATGGQPSSDDIMGALGIHNASNGEINAHATSKVERLIAKDPRDTGDLVGIPILLSDAAQSMLNLIERYHFLHKKNCRQTFNTFVLLFCNKPHTTIAALLLLLQSKIPQEADGSAREPHMRGRVGPD